MLLFDSTPGRMAALAAGAVSAATVARLTGIAWAVGADMLPGCGKEWALLGARRVKRLCWLL